MYEDDMDDGARTSQAVRLAAHELIEVLAHDLRTPLTPALGFVGLLREHAEQDQRTDDVHYAEQVQLALQRLNHMIETILDASHLEHGLFALDLQPVDLVALVQDTVDTLRTPQPRIHSVVPPALMVEQADPERLRQALENLIGNALQHTPPSVPILVEVTQERRADGAWAVVRVHDEGPGIPTTVLPTLFERFARGPYSTSLGLGLYLARRIVEAHGGTLTVESVAQQGTTFYLALPLHGGGP